MPGRFHEGLIVDHQFILGHPHRDGLADQPPRRRVEILAVDHEPLGVDGAVDDLGGVERACRQRDEVGLFLGMTIDRPRLGLAVDANVGDLGQPPRRGLVQVLQTAEGPAAKQARFDISKGSLDLPFCLGPPGTASHGAKAVMGRECQESWIVDRVVAVVVAHDDFHVVIKARRRDPAQVLEGADVLADGCGEILSLDEVEILPPRITQHVAEGVHAAATFVSEIQIIRGIIHLGLFPGGGLEPSHGRDDRTGTQTQHPFGEDRVTTRITALAQFFVNPSNRNGGVTRQQVGDRRFVGVELAAAHRRGSRRALRRCAASGLLDLPQCPVHRAAADPQAQGDPTYRRTTMKECNDLRDQLGVHGRLISNARSRAPSATQFASRATARRLVQAPGDPTPSGTSSRDIPGSFPPTPAGPEAPPSAC